MEVKDLSNEQLAGQRLMVGFNGTGLNNDLKLLIDTIKVGGIILFSQEFIFSRANQRPVLIRTGICIKMRATGLIYIH